MNGRRTLAATPAPKRETRFAPQLEGAALAPRSWKASWKTSPLHRFWPVPEYGACRFRRACAVKRIVEAASGILTREDKATAMRVLSLSGQVRGGRGTSSVFRVMAVSSEGAVVEIEDVRMGDPPGDERRSLVVERAFPTATT